MNNLFSFSDAILAANDSVLKIMIQYKKIVEGVSDENGLLDLGEGTPSEYMLIYILSLNILSYDAYIISILEYSIWVDTI